MKLFCAILFLSVLISCKSDYDFGIDSSSKPIINCLFHPDSIWKIEITQSPGSLWKYKFEPIKGALVRISLNDQNSLVMDKFDSDGLGFYSSSTEKVPSAPGQTVVLEMVNGDDTVTASSYFPPKPVFSMEVLDLLVTKYEIRSKTDRFNYGI